MDINAKIESLKLVPVVVLEDAKDALPLAKALILSLIHIFSVVQKITTEAPASISPSAIP